MRARGVNPRSLLSVAWCPVCQHDHRHLCTRPAKILAQTLFARGGTLRVFARPRGASPSGWLDGLPCFFGLCGKRGERASEKLGAPRPCLFDEAGRIIDAPAAEIHIGSDMRWVTLQICRREPPGPIVDIS